jgi:hypothetical protein
MNLWLIIFGGAIILIWGTAHIFPTRSVVAGFGDLAPDNRRILTMEWIAEGMTLMFLGVLATLSAATGARTKSLPMRLCPLVKITAAGLLVFWTWE